MSMTVNRAINLLTGGGELDLFDREFIANLIDDQATTIDDLNYERERLWEDAEHDLYRIRDLEDRIEELEAENE